MSHEGEIVEAELVGDGEDTISALADDAAPIEDADVVAPTSPESAQSVSGAEHRPPTRTVPVEGRPPVEDEEPPSFPRLYARTQRFTLGEPRTVTVSDDGRRIVFLRSTGGTDPVNRLWVVDATTGEERLAADPLELLGDAEGELPAEELRRRERTREAAGGITGYATDRAATLAAFALSGRLFVADLESGDAREIAVDGAVFDPRPDPLAQRIAYVSGPALCVAELDGSSGVVAGGDEPDTVTWGSADFIAAEEMHRHRGYWWNPGGTAVAATRVDTAPVQRAWIGDAADPTSPPAEIRYPFAGTANAEVSLHIVGLDGAVVDVEWDRGAYPYLTDVHWSAGGLIIQVQSRDQREVRVLDVDPESGSTTDRFVDADDAWVELVAGVPRLSADGRLVTCASRDGSSCLIVDGEQVTPAEVNVRSVVSAGSGGIVFVANPIDDATVAHIWRFAGGKLEALTDEPGVHAAAAGGGTVVIRTTTLDEPRASWDTLDGVELTSFAAEPNLALHATLHVFGRRQLSSVVLRPADHDGSPLPVLVDPYGGPHSLRAVRSHLSHLTSQWFADQGFAVIVTDGRGTPGRGSEWERAILGDLATPVLEDQIDALEQAAAELGFLDLDRVAIRGWSFGGYLAALAVLLRPDRFHAAIAGAPVTEWRLYDTHYTERYLGDPATAPDVYDGSSLLALAADLSRPLLLIHGLADDNVVAAHTLRLSAALLVAGRPHDVLPLVGVTHMTPQEIIAENLLLHQLGFLRRSLDLPLADYGSP